MKLINTKLRVLALAAGSLAISVAAARAQNANYAPGDLVLFFQQEGGTNTVYANLGNTATLYRGAATGAAGGTNSLNFLNLNATLTTAFGAGWATDTSIYAGLAGVWGTSSTNNSLQNGDPHRTLYVSADRTAVGTVGAANSVGWDLSSGGDTAMSGGATGIATQNNILETQYSAAVAVSPTSISSIDNQNPFLAPAVQGAAFGSPNGVFAGGVQQRGSAGIFASSFGPVSGSVEFALDLYRIQAKNNIVGQVGFGETTRVGTYEGTVTVGTNGDVSFVAVPEPSTYALLGLGVLAIGHAIRRRRLQKN